MYTKNFRTLVLVTLFALLFSVVGWFAPALYASYAPQDHYIEAGNFTVQDAQATDSEHVLCFERTIHKQSVGEVFTELYLIADDGSRVEVTSSKEEQVFQEGTRIIEVHTNVPPDIEPGEYRYERVYNMELANGRINRQFTFVSERFTIVDGNETATSEKNC